MNKIKRDPKRGNLIASYRFNFTPFEKRPLNNLQNFERKVSNFPIYLRLQNVIIRNDTIFRNRNRLIIEGKFRFKRISSSRSLTLAYIFRTLENRIRVYSLRKTLPHPRVYLISLPLSSPSLQRLAMFQPFTRYIIHAFDMETRVRVFEKKKKERKCFLEHSDDECKRRGEGIPIWYFDPLDPGLSFIQIHSSDTGGYPVARYGQSDPDTRCALPLLPFARPTISYALSMKLIILKFSLVGWIPVFSRMNSRTVYFLASPF